MGEDFKVGNQIPNFFPFQLQTQFWDAGDDVDKKRRVLNPEGLPQQTLNPEIFQFALFLIMYKIDSSYYGRIS